MCVNTHKGAFESDNLNNRTMEGGERKINQ